MCSPELVPFFSHGQLGPIRLGMTQERIKELLGFAEDTAHNKKQDWTILKYGRVELTLRGQHLSLIALNFYNMKAEDTLVQLSPTLMTPSSPVSLTRTKGDFLSSLDSFNVPYSKDEKRSDANHLIWNVGTCGDVVFDLELGMIVEAFASADKSTSPRRS